MPDDDPIWRLLHERALGETPPAGATGGPQRPGRESVASLLDALLGVLAATRHLVEVAEGVVREQRDRMATSDADPVETAADQSGASRNRITLSY